MAGKEMVKSEAVKSLRKAISSEAAQREIARALGEVMDAGTFIRVCLTAIHKNSKLAECTQGSVWVSILELAQYGLVPDGRLAYLIPYFDNTAREMRCRPSYDYKGLVFLAMQSGFVESIHGDAICENDTFVYDIGEIKEHRINFRKPRGDAYAYYAIARLKGGGTRAVVVDLEDVAKARSYAKTEGMWKAHPKPMGIKTAVHQLAKWVPMGKATKAVESEDSKLAEINSEFDELPTAMVERMPDDGAEAVAHAELPPGDPVELPPLSPTGEKLCALMEKKPLTTRMAVKTVMGRAVEGIHEMSEDQINQAVAAAEAEIARDAAKKGK